MRLRASSGFLRKASDSWSLMEWVVSSFWNGEPCAQPEGRGAEAYQLMDRTAAAAVMRGVGLPSSGETFRRCPQFLEEALRLEFYDSQTALLDFVESPQAIG